MTNNPDLSLDLKKTFIIKSGETLVDSDLPKVKYIIKDILPQGLAFIGGSPKVGKSWMVLDWVIRVAKGEKIWGLPTAKGTTLYLSLEDSYQRLKKRLLTITEEIPNNAFFSIYSLGMGNGLEEQLCNFISDYPDTALIVIDTFQIIRNQSGNDYSYAKDYNDIEAIKKIADELGITILLVHHLRKQHDVDPFNMLSGTNGLAGGVDTMFVLEKKDRFSQNAMLHCTGRDIEDIDINLNFNKQTCTWEYICDSHENPEILLPREMQELVLFMSSISSFSGSNTAFLEKYKDFSGFDIAANTFKRMMNRYENELNQNGVYFDSIRKNNVRILEIKYLNKSDEDDDKND